MTALHTEQKAAKEYSCAWACGSPIRRGERYVRATIPPGTLPPEMTDPDGPGWEVVRMHGHDRDGCPTFVHGDPDPLAEYAERFDLGKAAEQRQKAAEGVR